MDINVERVATEFVIEIVEEAMDRYNLTYEELEPILKKTGYLKKFDDTELMVTGAHHGTDEVMKGIGKDLEDLTKFKDNIPKPPKPHREVLPDEIPTQEQIDEKKRRIQKLKDLGIEVNILDGERVPGRFEEDIDKLILSIDIMSGGDLTAEQEVMMQ